MPFFDPRLLRVAFVVDILASFSFPSFSSFHLLFLLLFPHSLCSTSSHSPFALPFMLVFFLFIFISFTSLCYISSEYVSLLVLRLLRYSSRIMPNICCCFGISAFSESVFTQCRLAGATQGNIHSFVSYPNLCYGALFV
jgi:hypothetical protein